MEDNIANDPIIASNEPANQSPAIDSAHQMSDRGDLRQSGAIRPNADGQATSGDHQNRDRSNGSQLTGSSAGGEQFTEADGRLENGQLNWTSDQTSARESSRSSSLNSDRQKDEDRPESSDATILVKQERPDDEDYRNKIDSADEKSKVERGDDHTSGNDEASEASAKDRHAPPANQPDSYTDFAGVNLEEFLFNLLQTNPKDRMHLLKTEQDLSNLVRDEKRTSHRFPPMSSYHRMLVHRVAAYFGFEHNIDPKGTCVIVNKLEGITRIPELKFQDQINKQSAESEAPQKLILKRETTSLDGQQDGRTEARAANGLDPRKSKSRSYEEREEQYEKVRARIFSQQTARPADGQLSNVNESDKCNLENNQANYSPVSNNASTMNHTNHTKHRSNESLKNFSNYFDSGQAPYLNAAPPSNYPPPAFDGHPMSEHHPPFHPPHQLNSNSQFNHLEFNKSNHPNSSFKQPNGDLTADSKGFYKSNGYKGNKMPKGNPKQPNSVPTAGVPGSKLPKNAPPPPHFYQPNLLQMVNPLDPQLYPGNWLPADLNAAAAAAQQQQLYQPMPAYNQLHPNQQKLYLLCNYPETHPFNSDKMVPNQVVLPAAGMNHLPPPPGNGQPPNNNANKMEKENLNAYVASQMSGLSLSTMNAPADLNDVQNRASAIPICYLKPPYYPMASSNPNEMVYPSSLAQLPNQKMLLINPNFNPNTPPTLSNFNRPTNSILPAPAQSIGMTGSQRFPNPSNYPYPVNGSASHLEMNQMYPHMPTYLMPNTVRQQSPLLPTPVTAVKSLRHYPSNVPNKKKMNDNQLTNEQLNGMKNESRKKMNGFKNEKFEKKSLPQSERHQPAERHQTAERHQPAATKPKTAANLPPQQPQQQANANNLKGVPPASSNQNGTSRSQSSNGLSNKVV